jgi:NitT/TauT family transport system substrate-binding protein
MTPHRPVPSRAAVLAIIGALVIAACGGSTTAPSPAPPATQAAVTQAATPAPTPKPPKDKVKIPGVLSYELNLPSLIALAKDHFGEENIEVTDFVLGSGGTIRQAMIAKEYDFGLFAFVHVPIARLAGSPWKAVFQTHDREIFSFVVRSGLKDKVKTVADLKGMTVGFTTPGAGAWAFAQIYLKQAGLDPDKDVKLVSLGGDAGVIYAALETGKVDAFPAWEPNTTKAIDAGIVYPLISIYEPGVQKKVLGSDNAAATMLVTREDVIAAKPDLVKRMVNAHVKGIAFIRANSAAAIADVLLGFPKAAEQFKGLNKATVVKIIDRLKGGFGTGCLSKSGFDAEMKVSVDYGLVKQAITYKDYADTTWAGECP